MEDLSQAAAIEQEIFSQPWSEQGFADALASDCTVFLVAEDDGGNCRTAENIGQDSGSREAMCEKSHNRIVGYIGMYVSFDEAEITNVAVMEAARQQGVGSLLLEAVLAAGAAVGVKRFVLEVRVSNHPAVHLYQKYGFVKAGIRPGFYELPREDAWMMVREEAG